MQQSAVPLDENISYSEAGMEWSESCIGTTGENTWLESDMLLLICTLTSAQQGSEAGRRNRQFVVNR